MAEVRAKLAPGTPIEVWCQDEMRVGQKNKLTYRWARKGSRPRAVHDQRTQSTYLFGAVCPELGTGAALVLPACNSEAMQLHLDEIAIKVSPGAHAILLLDQAGWHGAKILKVPSNITLMPLPKLDQSDDARRSISEAMSVMDTSKEAWFEAEVHRIAGEIALMSPQPDIAKAEAYLEHALAVARQQQAKSWELRAAMSMARLWRDQGKRDQARALLAPIYDWFTEGFDTRDLRDANAMLSDLTT